MLAEARQAAVNEATLTLYSARLAQEDFQLVERAFAVLGERERADGETAFPMLGTILAEVRRYTPVMVLNRGKLVAEGSPEADGWQVMRGAE